jgi:hypothetical protein
MISLLVLITLKNYRGIKRLEERRITNTLNQKPDKIGRSPKLKPAPSPKTICFGTTLMGNFQSNESSTPTSQPYRLFPGKQSCDGAPTSALGTIASSVTQAPCNKGTFFKWH